MDRKSQLSAVQQAGVVHLGYEIPSGEPVSIPLSHLCATGQTRLSGKTTALEALISRSGRQAIAFITKRAEGAFTTGHRIPPYFKDRHDWQFVSDVLESRLREKLKFQRSWIMKVSRSAGSLADVQRNVKRELQAARRGLDQSVYTELDEYLSLVIPELERLPYTDALTLQTGLNVMDLSAYSTSLQMLVIGSVLEHVYMEESGVITIIPEAWEFIPGKRGSPVKRAAEALIRKSAAVENYVFLDSQDISGVDIDVRRQCHVWLLGVQREQNEIRRTLQAVDVPGGMKPKAADIRALGRGEFYACWSREVHKVYVQPAWMEDRVAVWVARGEENAESFARAGVVVEEQIRTDEVNMDWKEKYLDSERRRLELEQEVAGLKKQIKELSEDMPRSIPRGTPPNPPPANPSAAARFEGNGALSDDLYTAIRERLLKDPPVLRVLVTQPEIHVEVAREVVEADGTTLRGRLARLVAEGFFDTPATANAAHIELVKRGQGSAKPNVYKECDKLTTMGFLLKLSNGYQAVAGMKREIKIRQR